MFTPERRISTPPTPPPSPPLPPPPPSRSYLLISRSGSGTVLALAEVNALSSAEAPGYPYKNSSNKKNRKRAGDSFPVRSFFFLSPASPQHKETSAGERGGKRIYLNERWARIEFCVPQMWYSFDGGVYLLRHDKEFFLLVSVLCLVNTRIKKNVWLYSDLGEIK